MTDMLTINKMDCKGFHPIDRAISQGDVKKVKSYISQGANLNMTDGMYTSMSMAATKGRLEIVKILFDSGAYPHICSEYYCSFSALIAAAKNNHWEVVNFLIDKGVNLNLCDYHQFTALSIAASNNNFEIVKLLEERGANINMSTKYGTALSNAVANNHFKVVKYLIENGADVNLFVPKRGTALEEAYKASVSFKRLEMINLLKENGAYDLLDFAKQGEWEKVSLLLDIYCHISCVKKYEENETPLLYALKAQQFNIASRLYNHGDRLPFNIVNPGEMCSCDFFEVLSFLGREASLGRNYFIDYNYGLAWYCHYGEIDMAKRVLSQSTKAELGDAFFELFEAIDTEKNKDIFDFFNQLLELDADRILKQKNPEKYRDMLMLLNGHHKYRIPFYGPNLLEKLARRIRKR